MNLFLTENFRNQLILVDRAKEKKFAKGGLKIMASIKQMETKEGKRFFQISVSRGYGKAAYKMRWYWPDGWSKRTAE